MGEGEWRGGAIFQRRPISARDSGIPPVPTERLLPGAIPAAEEADVHKGPRDRPLPPPSEPYSSESKSSPRGHAQEAGPGQGTGMGAQLVRLPSASWPLLR